MYEKQKSEQVECCAAAISEGCAITTTFLRKDCGHYVERDDSYLFYSVGGL